MRRLGWREKMVMIGRERGIFVVADSGSSLRDDWNRSLGFKNLV